MGRPPGSDPRRVQVQAIPGKEPSHRKTLFEQRLPGRTTEFEKARLELIRQLSQAAEFYNTDMGKHVVRVGYYAKELADAMGLERGFREMLFLASPLHDLGKIRIPHRILLKRGSLTHEEWAIMKAHSRIGAKILGINMKDSEFFTGCFPGTLEENDLPDANFFLEMASSIALTHHERWDGSGYPLGLAGENIPMEGRIVAVADVYDALFSVRPYKRSFPEETVMEILEQERPKYDPDVFMAFKKRKDTFCEIRHRFSDRPTQD